MPEKRAFTLIEMLIVIAIIAILAVLAVSAYGGARRSAQIDLAADGLVSALKMQQGLSKSGRVVEGAGSRCFGMYFSKEVEEGQTQIQYVETPYYSVHPSRSEADVCDLSEKTLRKYEADADFELFMIEKFSQGNEAEELLILFKPPFARVVLGDLNNVEAPAGANIKFGIRLPSGENEKFIRFDTSTGLTERVYGEHA